MADSCRPVSRHGRYNSSGPSSMQYAGDVTAYGGMSYSPTDGTNLHLHKNWGKVGQF